MNAIKCDKKFHPRVHFWSISTGVGKVNSEKCLEIRALLGSKFWICVLIATKAQKSLTLCIFQSFILTQNPEFGRFSKLKAFLSFFPICSSSMGKPPPWEIHRILNCWLNFLIFNEHFWIIFLLFSNSFVFLFF